MKTLTEACELPQDDLRERIRDLRRRLVPLVTKSQRLETGFAFALALSDRAVSEAGEFVGFERRCCGFAQLELRIDESQGLVWVEVTGGPQAQPALEQMYAELVGPGARPGS